MSVQLFAKAINEAQYQRIDLFAAEPIKLTLSVANIVDPLAANSVFSRTFRVPHTSENGPFFKAAFNVNATDFDASKKADAYINDQGAFFSEGNIRLSAIYVNEKDNNVEYEINYYGETSDFGSKIGGGFLNQVDLSAYNHALSYTNTVNSWSGGLFGGDVVYPLIEWGYKYNKDGEVLQGTLSLWDNVNSLRGTILPANQNALCMDFKQLKPVIKAKIVWDAIFRSTGYTYDSTFLETNSIFTDLFLVAEDEARTELTNNLKFEADQDQFDTIEVGSNGPTSVIPPITNAICSIELSDPSNSYSPITSQYTATSPGTYQFRYEGNAFPVFTGQFTAGALLFRIVDVVTGATLASSSPQLFVANTQFNKTLAASLAVGQTVKLVVENISNSGNNNDYVIIAQSKFSCFAAPNLITMTSFMPSNIRKVDFMRSIINRFRLVFEPSRDNQKHFTITPWKDWVLQGSQRDWTKLLDGTTDMKITPLFYSQDRLQVFKDLEDADFVNYNYQLDVKQTFGQLNKDSNNELIKGTTTYQDQFAPMPLYPIGNVDPTDSLYAFVIPHLAKDTDTTREPIQPKLRLAYYNGLQPVPPVPPVGPGQPYTYAQGWWLNNTTNFPGVPVLHANYPLMSQFNQWPVTTSTFDLSWQNQDPTYDTASNNLPTDRTGFDCYNTFWKTWYDTTFDSFSRIVEANFVLGYEDILDLNFNDYIFVKDTWYFVNKISDYVIGQETNCKVELIKVGGNIGLVIPPSLPAFNLLQLCFSKTVPCDAFCCLGTAVSGLYYGNGTTLANSTNLYNDQFGQFPAGNGYYSDGVTTVITTGGFVFASVNTSGCDCNPPALFPYEVCYGSDSCEACCCVNGTIIVYGTSSIDLINSLNVYTDAGGTVPANGWFKQTGSTNSLNVINGITNAVGLCSACNCNPIIVYPHTVTVKSTDTPFCDVCCDEIPQTIFTDSATFISSTIVYIDNVPLTIAGAGRFRLIGTGDVLITDVNGLVISIGNCASCTCPNYYRARNCNDSNLIANFTYATPLPMGTVVTSLSYPGECWEIYGLATDGEPIDQIFTTCADCQGINNCPDCVSYLVNTISGGAIGYIDCSTGDVVYIDVLPNTAYYQCACRDSIIVLAGKIKITDEGPCDLPQNQLLVMGGFTEFDSNPTEFTALLDINGNVQDEFSTFQGGGTAFNLTVLDLIALNNSLFVCGTFTQYNGTAVQRLIKLDYTGAIDPTYDATTGFNSSVDAAAKFLDGALVFTGVFTTYKGQTKNRIVAIDETGVIDSTFNTGTGFNQTIRRVEIKNDIAYCLAETTNLVTYKGVSGSRFVSLNRQGNLIANFGLNILDIPTSLKYAIDNLGRVYIGYVLTAQNVVKVRRFLANGSLDNTFTFEIATNSFSTNYSSSRVNLVVDDSLNVILHYLDRSISSPSRIDSRIIKIRPDGTLDPTFGNHLIKNGGISASNPHGIVLKANEILITSDLVINTEPTTYDINTEIGSLIAINATTGELVPTFNNTSTRNQLDGIYIKQ